MRRRIGLCAVLWLACACSSGTSHPSTVVEASGARLDAHYNPAVTQAPSYETPPWAEPVTDTFRQTICKPGWTATIRPPVSYTNRIKRALWVQAGSKGKLSDFELDHVVPLGSGGAPFDRVNLALQPWGGVDGAHAKDVVEVRVQREICAFKITLAAARACFVVDWRTCP